MPAGALSDAGQEGEGGGDEVREGGVFHPPGSGITTL
jgi:hypothetical protein